ncbi:hypothetical protein EP232_05950 [bacterium]|nr:MAG: hypothetical protein EP232_05950 [bacterium]
MNRPLLAIVVLTVCLVSLPAPVMSQSNGEDEWKVIVDPPIEVRYQGKAVALAEDVAERAKTFLDDVSNLLGLPQGGPYVIILAGSKEEFLEIQPASSTAPEWAGALTYPRYGVVLLMTPGAMKTSGRQYWSLLQHEMVHLVIGEAETKQGVRFPRWLSEGIATFISGEMGLSRLLHLSWAQVTRRAIPLDDLAFSFPDDPAMAEVAYAQSFLFVQYLMRKFGEDAVAQLVTALLEEGSLARAVNRAFDMSLGELFEGFHQYARVKATWIPVITSTAAVWSVITLLFLYTYIGRRIRDYRTLRRWDEEEILEERTKISEEDDDEYMGPTIH